MGLIPTTMVERMIEVYEGAPLGVLWWIVAIAVTTVPLLLVMIPSNLSNGVKWNDR